MDYVVSEDYRTIYHRNKDLFTYKMDFEHVVLSTEFCNKVYKKRRRIIPETGSKENFCASELTSAWEL